MRSPSLCLPAIEAEGIVQHVDPVVRELRVVVAGAPVSIHVPPDCDVVLRGERVKLRMVQPGDRVRVVYTTRDDSPRAHRLVVHPGRSSST